MGSGMRNLAWAWVLSSLVAVAQINPYRYLATLEFDGQDWFDSGEQVFPTSFRFNTTQDSNNDGSVDPEDNLENIITFHIGNNLIGTGKTGLSNRGPNDQRPAVYYHYVDTGPWRVHQYWLYYADNDWINNHEHDWEFYFVYTVQGVITHVAYSRHGSINIETWCSINKDGNHPRLGVDGGAHAMKNSSEDGVRIRYNGFIDRRNGQLNFDTATIPWVIYSNDPGVVGAVSFVMAPDTFYYDDPFYGGNEYGDPRLAPWLRTRWTQPELPNAAPPAPNLPDTVFLYLCPGDTVVLDAGSGMISYLWNTGATSQTITVTTPGLYWVEVQSSADGCTYTFRDSVWVIGRTLPAAPLLPDDTAICTDDSLVLTVPAGSFQFVWEDGSNDPIRVVYAPDTVILMLFYSEDARCFVADTMYVLELPPLTVQLDSFLQNSTWCYYFTGQADSVWWEADGQPLATDTVCTDAYNEVCFHAFTICDTLTVCRHSVVNTILDPVRLAPCRAVSWATLDGREIPVPTKAISATLMPGVYIATLQCPSGLERRLIFYPGRP